MVNPDSTQDKLRNGPQRKSQGKSQEKSKAQAQKPKGARSPSEQFDKIRQEGSLGTSSGKSENRFQEPTPVETSSKHSWIVALVIVLLGTVVAGGVYYALLEFEKLPADIQRFGEDEKQGYRALQSGDPQDCLEIEDDAKALLCVTTLAKRGANVGVCSAAANLADARYRYGGRVADVSAENLCVARFVEYTEEAEVCDAITDNEELTGYCREVIAAGGFLTGEEFAERIESVDQEQCLELAEQDAELSVECLSKQAESTLNPEICEAGAEIENALGSYGFTDPEVQINPHQACLTRYIFRVPDEAERACALLAETDVTDELYNQLCAL